MQLEAQVVFPEPYLSRPTKSETCMWTEDRSVVFVAGQEPDNSRRVEFVLDRANGLRCDATEVLDASIKVRVKTNVGWVESSRPTLVMIACFGGPRRLDPPYFELESERTRNSRNESAAK